MAADLREIAGRVGEWLRANRRASLLLIATLILAVVYLVFVVGWFRSDEIVILYRTQVVLRDDGSRRIRVVFDLDSPRELRRVSVHEVDGSGERGREVWRLVRGDDEASRPVDAFEYGRGISGLKEAEGVPRADLVIGGSYELLIVAHGARGRTRFVVDPRSHIRRRR